MEGNTHVAEMIEIGGSTTADVSKLQPPAAQFMRGGLDEAIDMSDVVPVIRKNRIVRMNTQDR